MNQGKQVHQIFPSDATYLLPGGLGGVGRSVAAWMVERGAKNIMFTSRSGEKNPKAAELVRKLRSMGANVEAFACDISNTRDLEMVIKAVSAKYPPIRGVVTFAMEIQVHDPDTLLLLLMLTKIGCI